MPYVLVETRHVTGSRKLLAAPATWVLRCEETFYLCWPPQVRNAMLADDTSLPSADWERRECKIVCKNIQSYASAQDLVAKLALHGKQTNAEAVRGKIQNAVPSTAMLMDMVDNLQNEIMPEMFSSVSPKQEEDPLEVDTESVANEQQRSNGVKLFSTGNLEDNDPLADAKPSSQLVDLVHEIKCLIISNQEKIRKKLNEGFYRMQKTMLSMVGNRLPDELVTALEKSTANAPACKDNFALEIVEIDTDFSDDPNALDLSAFTHREELDAFEDRLNDEEYRRRVYAWINDNVSHEANPETRMMDVLDLLMDRKFFTQCSWKSHPRYQKIPLSEYVNFCQLFQYVGTTLVHRADAAFVEYFFKKKMKHALDRIHLRGLRRCVAKRVPRRRNSDKSVTNESATGRQMIVQEEPREMEVEHNIETCLPETNQTSPATTEIVVVDVNPITCEEGMFDFDTQLGHDDYREEVHRWIDTTVGHLSDPEQRMREILEKLVDRSFLLNFSWTKETIARYGNFVRLLEYVGTTDHHLASHTFVGIFLRKKLPPPGFAVGGRT